MQIQNMVAHGAGGLQPLKNRAKVQHRHPLTQPSIRHATACWVSVIQACMQVYCHFGRAVRTAANEACSVSSLINCSTGTLSVKVLEESSLLLQ